MEEKILTKHPTGKRGVNISKAKYDAMRATILECLHGAKEVTHPQLDTCVNKKLKDKFDRSVSWYMECVKLDLEARRVVERTGTKPQRYRLANAKAR